MLADELIFKVIDILKHREPDFCLEFYLFATSTIFEIENLYHSWHVQNRLPMSNRIPL